MDVSARYDVINVAVDKIDTSDACGTGSSRMSNFVARKKQEALRYLIKEWDNLVTPRAREHAQQQTYRADLRRTRLAALGRELAGMTLQERRSRKPSTVSQRHPADAKEEGAFVAPDLQESFFAFQRGMCMLKQRLGATCMPSAPMGQIEVIA